MLASALLVGVFAAPLSSAALFLNGRRPRRVAGALAATRRLVLALLGTAVLAAVVGGALYLLGVPGTQTIVATAGLVAMSLAWLPATRRWNAAGHLAWSSSVYLFASYLVFILDWTFASHLGPFSTAGGVLLWLLELFAAVLACAYLWELCDALGTERWRRRVTAGQPTPEVDGELPFVSLHVPAHNEPPEMVIETLASLLKMDYPRYQIVAIDDNTDDESLWRPVEAWCAEHGVTFAHLDNWPGYKSGALNYALGELTDPATELIGVVDSDYQLDPGFLRRCAPLFVDPAVGFIQAPQDYRDWSQTPYYRRLYYSYKYFFAVSQPSRNEHDGAIFAGTMGLIRKQALVDAGGWDEWCITEDAELSLRLLHAGWSGLHVDQSWGRGVMPLTFEALKSQRYRWCFGGIQILRMHLRWLLPGGGAGNRMSLAQRWAYLGGGVQWYGDLLGLVFYLFLLAGAINIATGGDQLFRKLTAFLVATVPVLVALGLVRAVALLRRGTEATWRDAIGAFFVWQSTSLVVARASVQGLFARKAAFLRTPKTTESAKWWQAFRANWAETLLTVAGLAAIAGALTRPTTLSGPLLAGLLVFPTLGFAAAPFNSLAAQRAALPPQLRARRRSEWSRDRRTLVGSAAAGGSVALLIAMAGLLGLLLAPSHHLVSPPSLVHPGPARTRPVPSRTPSVPPTPVPSTSDTSGTGTPSGGASPTGGGTGTTTGGPPSPTAGSGTGTVIPTPPTSTP